MGQGLVELPGLLRRHGGSELVFHWWAQALVLIESKPYGREARQSSFEVITAFLRSSSRERKEKFWRRCEARGDKERQRVTPKGGRGTRASHILLLWRNQSLAGFALSATSKLRATSVAAGEPSRRHCLTLSITFVRSHGAYADFFLSSGIAAPSVIARKRNEAPPSRMRRSRASLPAANSF
jgi:hypothetical protein